MLHGVLEGVIRCVFQGFGDADDAENRGDRQNGVAD